MQNYAIRFIAIFAVSLLSLTGCSPVYQTSYIYHPIKGRDGQMCSNICLTSRTSCEQFARQAYTQCESQSEMEYKICESSKRYGYNKKGEWECLSNCYCSRRSCSSPELEECEATYRECHFNCGGEVTANTSCTAFCDGALPPASQRQRKTESGVLADVTDEPVNSGRKRR